MQPAISSGIAISGVYVRPGKTRILGGIAVDVRMTIARARRHVEIHRCRGLRSCVKPKRVCSKVPAAAAPSTKSRLVIMQSLR